MRRKKSKQAAASKSSNPAQEESKCIKVPLQRNNSEKAGRFRNSLESIRKNLITQMFTSGSDSQESDGSAELKKLIKEIPKPSRFSYEEPHSVKNNQDEDGLNANIQTRSPNRQRTSPTKRSKSLILLGDADFSEHFRSEINEMEIPSLYFISGDFANFYEEMEILGQGCSGIVKKCRSVHSGEVFAVKITNSNSDEEKIILHLKEFSKRQKLSHRNVINVSEMYIDCMKNKIYTVMEYFAGKELQKVIESRGCLSETKAAQIFKQIVLGIQYLHRNGVCHRDLKLQNILVSKDTENVKIIDFNVSKFNDASSKPYSALSTANFKMWTYTGTVAYLAPEVFQDMEYTEVVDTWSAGVILYTMLCGYHPFQAEFKEDLIGKITTGDYETSEGIWRDRSDEVKDLLKHLLEKNPKIRYSPFQAISHPWVINKGIKILKEKPIHQKITSPKNSSRSMLQDVAISITMTPKA